MMKSLFEQSLQISSPLQILSIDFEHESGRLDIYLDFKRGSEFIDEDDVICKVHDATDKTWRHLNFFQHECYLHARVPGIKRDNGKVKLID